MSHNEHLGRLENINWSALNNNIIFNDEYGYHLFGKYHISKGQEQYRVVRETDDSIRMFAKLRYAATWCILDRYNKIVEAKRVVEINSTLESLWAEMLVHKKLQKNSNLEIQEIGRDKYLAALDKQKRFQYELDKYIKLAKRCQDKGYENELTRTARK